MRLKFYQAIASIGRTIAPPLCFGCHQPMASAGFCAACYKKIHPIAAPYCVNCAAPLPYNDVGCDACTHKNNYCLHMRALFVYTGTLRHAILRLKQQHNTAFINWLGASMAQAAATLPQFDVVVCVPVAWPTLWRRLYNQAAAIACPIGAQYNVPFYVRALRKNWRYAAQKGLNRTERLQNVRELFAAGRDIAHVQNRHVLLVDDVVTTGATLEACAHILHQHGARSVSALVACYTPLYAVN
jgi:ComF family protein